MHKPWIMATLAFLSPPESPLPSMNLLAQEGPNPGEERSTREKRNFSVTVDHHKKQIRIKAWFFTARDRPDERKQLAAILKFWRRQNGRFVYRLGKGNSAVDYHIHFEVRRAAVTHSRDSYLLLGSSISPHLATQIEVISRKKMDRLQANRHTGRVVGYAPPNFIYIADDVAQQTWIGIHEAGHRMGLSHEARGIMNPSVDLFNKKVSKQAIRQILACANIFGRTHNGPGLADYPARAAWVEHVGEAPEGFFSQGKVKRL